MKRLGPIIAASLGYAVLGWLGLTLAVSPGYASPVFPAAGLAIAIALYYGNRILPGIWLGSLAINILVSWQSGRLAPAGVLVAGILGCGATLQTWAAARLVQRWLKDTWRSMETEQEIALFLTIAGPFACLISATTGAATLYFAGIIPATELLYSWWNWWLGDTLGVLIFTPLTLIVLLRAKSPWKERRLTVAVPMLITLGLVIAVFLAVAHWERQQLQDRIDDQGSKLAKLLDRRIVAHEEVLASLCRLIEVNPDMTWSQFEYFTRITLKDNPDIFALSYNHYIPQSERRGYEKEMARKNGLPDYAIRERNSDKQLAPAGDRPYYVAVGYIAPLEGNRPAIGFDINSEPIRRNAIDRAIANGKPAVTAPIQLVQENRQRVGVLVLHPAYRTVAANNGEKKHQLFGFAVGVIKVDELAQIAIGRELAPGLVFRLADAAAEAGRKSFYSSDAGQEKVIREFAWRTSLTKADRQWELEVCPTDAYLRQHRSWLAWGVGVVGLLFTALLQLMLMAMTGRTAIVQHKVSEQTRELSQAKEQLELLNRSLQERIDAAVAELRQKDQVLISQSRQAAMGEMIGNIAHQWRQPLNALAMLIANLQFAKNGNELTDEYMNKSAETANRIIQKMSSTINDFSNFFRPNKEMTTFSALGQINQAVNLVDAAFTNSSIGITVDSRGDILLNGFPNEYSQVLLNLLTNARDAIVETSSLPGQIAITLTEQDGMGVVTVRDNGGGIPAAILDKVFEPYYSTKNMGTGIGLYMSKMIVERNMNGRLSVRNISGGCEFSIMLPLAERTK